MAPRYFNETPFLFTLVEGTGPGGGRCSSIVVKATFDIVPGKPATPSKEQRPMAGDTPFMDDLGRSLAWPDDLVPYKPNTDFFVIGSFHAAGGVPVAESTVEVRFGPFVKRLRIRGPRVATRQQGEKDWLVSPPQPVRSVPLRWELCLGGLRDKRNPYGLGGDIEAKEGLETRRLPLIESMAAPAEPDNVAPVSPMFEQRRRKLGTRDQRWALFRAPLPPDDFDPSHVNAAPNDQQAGDSPRGDEQITLVNMHPGQPTLTFFLPGARARVAILRRTSKEPVAEEVPLRLDTVGVLADAGKLVLVWRGIVEGLTGNPEEQLLMLLCAAQALDAPVPDPDLPERLLRYHRDGEEREQAKREALDAATQAGIMRLLPKAKLPQDLADMITAKDDPKKILGALEKHIFDTLEALEKKAGLK